jgi:transcription antitermination factor NusG
LSPHPDPWYAIRVKSNRERVTAQALTGKGFQVCLPLYSERRLQANSARTLRLPLFPGYIFCSFDVSDRLPILTVPGVVHIVSFGKTPQPVHEGEMAALLTILRSGLHAIPHPALPVGQRIRLNSGPLTGVEGVILAHKGEERLVVSVTLLQRSIAVEVDRQWIRLAGRTAA